MKLRTLVQSLLFIGVCSLLMAQEGGQENTIYDDTIKAVHVEELTYPVMPWLLFIEGVVVIKAKLDSQGNVVSSEALSGHKLLVPDSTSNSLKWSFEPSAVKEVIIVYDFRIEGNCPATIKECTKFTFRPPNFATIMAKHIRVET